VRRLLAGIGKVLITLGLLILLFVAYQLWGTGLYTARAQNQLERDFEAALRRVDRGSVPASTTTAPTMPGRPPTSVPVATTTLPAPPPAPEGGAIAHLVIPKIGVDSYVVQGVDEADLRKGPGHYPVTPLPGQVGNAAIAGHRTTYGAPFGALDDLEAGDQIRVTTLQGSFEYRIYDKLVVAPDAFEVLEPDPNRPATLTLTTCHPKYSAAQRLVVKAELVLAQGAEPLPSSVDPEDPAVKRAEAGKALSGDSSSNAPTILVGALTALIGALWWLLFHRHPHWMTWIVGAIPFAVSLFAFYFLFERVLPANY